MSDNNIKLGHLKSLGVKETWQLPLLVPRRYEILDSEKILHQRIDKLEDDQSAILLLVPIEITRPQKTGGSKGRSPGKVLLTDRYKNKIVGTFFNPYLIDNFKEGEPILVKGKVKVLPSFYGNKVFFNIFNTYPVDLLDTVMPVYPGTKQISPETVSKRMSLYLPQTIDACAQRVEEGLPDNWPEIVGSKKGDIASILRYLHCLNPLPDPYKVFRGALQAKTLMMRIDALHMLLKSLNSVPDDIPLEPLKLKRRALQEHMDKARLGFELTSSQKEALDEIMTDLRRPVAMRRLLQGDVGSGKTITYLIPAATLAASGYRTAVLMPNIVLSQQIANEAKRFFPELNIVLVDGKSKSKQAKQIQEGDIVVGTTALLNREIGDINFLVVDEQQKFSVEQREKLAEKHVHVLEVSATPIPRTQALTEFGGMAMSILKSGHADKDIETKIFPIWDKQDKRALFNDMLKAVERGDQLAVVYPLKHGDEEDEDDKAKKSAVRAFEYWKRHLPEEMIALVHGDMKDEEKKAAIEAMKSGKAKVLITTSVIEVGVTIPNLRYLAVVEAQRYGLSTLHQLRGRLARHGGHGRLVLMVEEPSDEILERLSILEETTDGAKVAEHDLKTRGYGELCRDGEAQSGLKNDFLINEKIPFEALQYVSERIQEPVREKADPIPWLEDVQMQEKPKEIKQETLNEALENAVSEEEDAVSEEDGPAQKTFSF